MSYLPNLMGYKTLEERNVQILVWMVENGKSIRQTAKHWNLGKSTIHLMATRYMEQHKRSVLSKKIRKLFDLHLANRSQNFFAKKK